MEFKAIYWSDKDWYLLNSRYDYVVAEYLNLSIEEFHNIIKEYNGKFDNNNFHYFDSKKDCEKCIEEGLLPYIMLAKLGE